MGKWGGGGRCRYCRRIRRRRSEFATTMTLLAAIAPAAMIGLMTPATARGTATMVRAELGQERSQARQTGLLAMFTLV
jgi:hypothetical protein